MEGQLLYESFLQQPVCSWQDCADRKYKYEKVMSISIPVPRLTESGCSKGQSGLHCYHPGQDPGLPAASEFPISF